MLATWRAYAGVSHPSLAKVLGGDKRDEDLVLLEEYVSGVPLNTLQLLAFTQHTPIVSCIAARVLLDTLRSAVALRQDCLNQGLPVPKRILFPDAVVVAEYGESLLSAIGVTQDVRSCRSIREHPEMIELLDPEEWRGMPCADERFEVFTAGAMLWKLLVVRGLFADSAPQSSMVALLHTHNSSVEDRKRLNLCVPQPIAAIIRRATLHNPGFRYQSLREMIQALEALPAMLIGNDEQVRTWLGTLAKDFLLDSQWSAGLRPRHLDAPPESSDGAWSQQPSSSRRFPRSDYPTLAARGATLKPAGSSGRVPAPSEVTVRVESYPAKVVSSDLIVIRSTLRPNRRTFVASAALGLTLAAALSYLGSRHRFSSAAAARIPVQTQAPLVTMKLSEPVPDAGHDEPVVDDTNSDRATVRDPPARSRAPLRSRASSRKGIDRWGI
jgi:hypothetical protein